VDLANIQKRLAKLKKITGASDRTGWMVDEVSFIIYSLIKFYKPSLVLQIGHLWGKSALVSMEALTDGFLMDGARIEKGALSGDKKFLAFVKTKWPKNSRGHLISVDAFPYGNWKKGISYLQKVYGKDRFEFVVEKSDEFFKAKSEELRKVYGGDIILGVVDGDHSYEACMKDITNMAKLGADHIVVDDIMWLPHINYICEKFVKTHKDYKLSTFYVYNGLAVLSKR